jgi:hypothetical protein
MNKHAVSHSTWRHAPGQTAVALAGTLSLAGLLLLGGCNKTPAPAAPAPDSPSTAQATPAPAPAPAPATEPAAAPAPAPAPTPAPAPEAPPPPMQAMTAPPAAPPPPPAPKVYTVPSGTPLAVRMEQAVSAKTNSVGDSFSGALAQSVVVHGVTVLRAGTPVTGTVVGAKGQGRFKGNGDLAIAIHRVGNYSVTTTTYEKAVSGKGKRTAGFIGGGGGGGALIGGLAGGGKGALIGGLLGAGAGTAGAAFTGNKDITIPAETVITVNLSEPITVTKSAPSEPR